MHSTTSLQETDVTENVPVANQNSSPPKPLTIFAFLWACQALVHQEFYSGWLHQNDFRGWAVTILAVGTLLRPSSIVLFAGMLLSSILYNVAKWPFVVNHILLESIINTTILGAIVHSSLFCRRKQHTFNSLRDEIFERFSPVIWIMLVVMYAFAFLAKLNSDFINPEVSCVVAMYGDLLRRFPFLPNDLQTHQAVILMTLLVEALIPLLLVFRRTRWMAILIGIPFHVMLGLVGHRTFSALAFALYALLCMNGIAPFVAQCRQVLANRIARSTRRRVYWLTAVATVAGVCVLIAADLSGNFRAKVAGVGIYQFPWLIWMGWSLLIGSLCVTGIAWPRLRINANPAVPSPCRPGWLWCFIPLVILIGLSQYIGLKTETCFTMYSNLRTEADWNNHLFMPTIKLGPWQQDLVTINATDHPKLQQYLEHDDLITFFELRRIVSSTSIHQPFFLAYERNGKRQFLGAAKHRITQTESWGKHPELLGMLLYFRPVPTDECVPCRH